MARFEPRLQVGSDSPFAKGVLAAFNSAERGCEPGFGMLFRPKLIKWKLRLRVLVRISVPRRPFQTGTELCSRSSPVRVLTCLPAGQRGGHRCTNASNILSLSSTAAAEAGRPTLTVCNLDEDLVRHLRIRAAEYGRSAEADTERFSGPRSPASRQQAAERLAAFRQ